MEIYFDYFSHLALWSAILSVPADSVVFEQGRLLSRGR